MGTELSTDPALLPFPAVLLPHAAVLIHLQSLPLENENGAKRNEIKTHRGCIRATVCHVPRLFG